MAEVRRLEMFFPSLGFFDPVLGSSSSSSLSGLLLWTLWFLLVFVPPVCYRIWVCYALLFAASLQSSITDALCFDCGIAN